MVVTPPESAGDLGEECESPPQAPGPNATLMSRGIEGVGHRIFLVLPQSIELTRETVLSQSMGQATVEHVNLGG